MAPRTPQTARTNITGRQREQQIKDNADEIKETQKRLGMMSRVEEVIEQEGVYDPDTGTLLEAPEGAEDLVEVVAQWSADTEEVDAEPVDLTTDELPHVDDIEDTMRELASIVPTKRQEPQKSTGNILVKDVEPIVVAPDTEVVRCIETQEQVTYGAGRTFDLFAGQKYRMPPHMAAHFASKGLVIRQGRNF